MVRRSTARRSMIRPVSEGERPLLRSPWFWACIAIAIALFALWSLTAAAQTQRASQIIERALALEPDDRDGAALYRELCAACHGKRGGGNAATVAPVLAGQIQHYLIKQLVDFAEGDRTAPEMHRVVALKRLTTPQAMRNLASYVNGLAASSAPEAGDGKQLALGKRVYDSLCTECHGMAGEGNEQYAVPALQRQHYSYLLSQMRSLAVGHRYSVDITVIQLLEALSFDQLTAVADYASRLPPFDAEPIGNGDIPHFRSPLDRK